MAAGKIVSNSGRIFQPQNLIRTPDWFDEHVQEITIAALKADCEDIIYENVSERCAFVVRGSLVAGEGKKFLIADLSNIEGRGLAWLAGEEWKIEAFKAYDRGEGPDLYKVTAGRILAKPPVDVTKDERQTQGKVPELAGGYGGGLGAYRTMGGKVFDAMSDDEIMEIVHAWRKAHPATKRFWYDVEGAVRCAIKAADEGKLGESFDVRGLLRIDTANGPDGVRYVRIRLPSGAYLVYRDMVIEDNGQLTYEGLNQYTRKWERLETYYGKLVENIVQSVSRDVFMSGLRRAELDDLCVVLRVHDELVCEVPDDPAYTVERLVACMATVPGWAAGLPLKAEGFECKRYRK
jgi:DNA polymerase